MTKQNATIALCYIRQSLTRDNDDKNSPERQRANIQAICDQKGWTPEWYEDAQGHKSGRTEKNRHEWLALKNRLADPDVVALVANDLSRLHRKGWRIGDLLETLDQYDVALTLAAPGRQQQIDTSTHQGRLFAQLSAMFDEYYAEDIAQRARDSVAYRKARGISVGRPPFGTVRDDEGQLTASQDGAWLLADGTFARGKADKEPETSVVWRSYHQTAEYILRLYAEGTVGQTKIAYRLAEEGWPFCDRKGKPRPITTSDVRRVVANWPEYAGIVMDERAQDRPGYQHVDIARFELHEERAIFDLELLKSVAEIRMKRAKRPVNTGIKPKTFPYPLAGIIYCAHCEQLAKKHNNPRLRSRLGGVHANVEDKITRYRHKAGHDCGAQNRSVPSEVIERDFAHLLQMLTIDPEKIDLMQQIALDIDLIGRGSEENKELAQNREAAIVACKKRIDAAIHLYGDGRIDRAEYLRRIEKNEREIAHWEAKSTKLDQLAAELTMCVETIGKLAQLWDMLTPEDKQGLVQSLFEEITFDLDTWQITGFTLKEWATNYVILRGALYDNNSTRTDTQEEYKGSLHTGFEPVFPP